MLKENMPARMVVVQVQTHLPMGVLAVVPVAVAEVVVVEINFKEKTT